MKPGELKVSAKLEDILGTIASALSVLAGRKFVADAPPPVPHVFTVTPSISHAINPDGTMNVNAVHVYVVACSCGWELVTWRAEVPRSALEGALLIHLEHVKGLRRG